MRTLRTALVLFLVALSLPLSYVLTRTYSGLRQEEISRLRFFASALFDAVEGELAELIFMEEGRPVDAYGISNDEGAVTSSATGEQRKGRVAVAVGGRAARAPHATSPLRHLPAQSWLRGYLQNHPDGGFQTPLSGDNAETDRRRKELSAYNDRFNAMRFQIPRSPPPAEIFPEITTQRLAEPLADEEGAAEPYLYQSSPSKARSAMARQKSRLEEITASQARKVTRQRSQQTESTPGPAPTANAATEAAASRIGATQTDAAVTASGEALEMELSAGATAASRQVEVAPFQALLLDPNRAFIFRRILIEGEAYRQGFVLDLAGFGQHLLATHFADQPLARFTQLQLWARTENAPQLIGTLGKSSDNPSLTMERQFPRPFTFLTARLLCNEIPPSSARAPLRLTLIALGLVLLVGMLAIHRSVNAQVALSRRRSQFASAVTHELKTPLTTIRMYVEMLAQGMADDPQRRQRYLAILDSETARLGRLINNVLELSRLEKRQRPLSYRVGDLSDVIQKVDAALGPQLAAADFDFQVKNRLKEPFAYDGEVLVQVLSNLIENSLKFGRDSDRKLIHLEIWKHRGMVHLAVTDAGPGIPQRDLKQIFDDFYRAEDEMTRTTAGTGIGLALVKRFAQAMNGRVMARNNPKGGCTITLVLPVKADGPY
ncbi:MAG: HAMP domain-containing sensor histidine kinase [Desulfosarcinaceae bacterium]|nr:HAMP domain-containing sensor histidine kinase [Desulfosarcinaceae bacterium]